MATSTVLIMVLGALAGTGVVLLVSALRPRPHREGAVRHGGPSLVDRVGRRGLVAAAVALAVLVLTSWPVAAVGAAVLVLCWSALFGGALGLLVARWTLALIRAMLPADAANVILFEVDVSIMLFAAALSVGFAVSGSSGSWLYTAVDQSTSPSMALAYGSRSSFAGLQRCPSHGAHGPYTRNP